MKIRREDVIQNLKDVGLRENEIMRCMSWFDENNFQDTYSFLRSIRCCMLDEVHMAQKKLDQLDYLLFILKMSSESEEK